MPCILLLHTQVLALMTNNINVMRLWELSDCKIQQDNNEQHNQTNVHSSLQTAVGITQFI